MKLAGFTGEHAPAQCVAVRWRDIDSLTVAQAIRTDVAIVRRVCCRGNGRQDRKPEKRDGGNDSNRSHGLYIVHEISSGAADTGMYVRNLGNVPALSHARFHSFSASS